MGTTGFHLTLFFLSCSVPPASLAVVTSGAACVQLRGWWLCIQAILDRSGSAWYGRAYQRLLGSCKEIMDHEGSLSPEAGEE